MEPVTVTPSRLLPVIVPPDWMPSLTVSTHLPDESLAKLSFGVLASSWNRIPLSLMTTFSPSVVYVPPTMVRPWKNSASTSSALTLPEAITSDATSVNVFHESPSQTSTSTISDSNGTSTDGLLSGSPCAYV